MSQRIDFPHPNQKPMELKRQDEINELYKNIRNSYKDINVVFDTTPMFPPKPLPIDTSVVTIEDINGCFDSCRKVGIVDIIVSRSRTTGTYDVVLDSMSQRAVKPDGEDDE